MSEQIEVIARVRVLVTFEEPDEDCLECIEDEYNGDAYAWRCAVAEEESAYALKGIRGGDITVTECDVLNCG
jgi:hypothetical protein